MRLPAIVVNFKTYPSASGKNALTLAKIHQKVAAKTGASIVIAVQALDVRMIAAEVDIPVLAQHFDLAEEGAFTGHVTPHNLKAAGAFGSLLNHAEKKLSLETLEKSIDLARLLGLYTIVCADSAYAGKAVSDLDPDMIAVEPPELIGGDVSVCSAEPQVIIDAVRMIGPGKVLVGAGIKNGADVRASLEYGASGVLLASGVVKSLDPEKTLYDLVSGLTKAR